MSRQFPLQGQWWEVTTNGEFVGVRATLGTADEIRQLIKALEAYVPFFEERDAASVDTHPKDGDAKQAPLVSGAVPPTAGDAQ